MLVVFLVSNTWNRMLQTIVSNHFLVSNPQLAHFSLQDQKKENSSILKWFQNAPQIAAEQREREAAARAEAEQKRKEVEKEEERKRREQARKRRKEQEDRDLCGFGGLYDRYY
jgi:hypothetical protein